MNHEQAAQLRADATGLPIIGVQWPDGSLLPVGLTYGKWLLAQTPNLTEAFTCWPGGVTPVQSAPEDDMKIYLESLA